MAINGLNIQMIWGKIKVEEFNNQKSGYPKGFTSTTTFFGAQVIFFLLAIVLMIIYGFKLM